LEKKLAPFENPEVSIKNVEREFYRVIPITEKIVLEENKKRKFDEVIEIEEIKILRDSPASKILKVGPAPQHILPPQGVIKKI